MVIIEGKPSATFNAKFLQELKYLQSIAASVRAGFLVFNGESKPLSGNVGLLNTVQVERVFEV